MEFDGEEEYARFCRNAEGRGITEALQATEMDTLRARLDELDQKIMKLEESVTKDQSIIGFLMKHSKIDKASIANASERIRALELQLKVRDLRNSLEMGDAQSLVETVPATFSASRLLTKVNNAISRRSRLKNFQILAATEKLQPAISVPPEPKPIAKPVVVTAVEKQAIAPKQTGNTRNEKKSDAGNSFGSSPNLTDYRKMYPELYRSEVRVHINRLKILATPVTLKQTDFHSIESAGKTSVPSASVTHGSDLDDEMDIADSDGDLDTTPEASRDCDSEQPSPNSEAETLEFFSECNPQEMDPVDDNTHVSISESKSEGHHSISTDSDFEVVVEDSSSFKSGSSEQSDISPSNFDADNESWSGSYQDSEDSNASSNIVNEPCPVCNKLIKYSYNLVRHMKTHEGNQNFRCKLCWKIFPNKGELLKHRASHSSLHLSCEHCPKKFGKRDHLNAHMKSHQESDNFSCPDCGKTFSQSSNLKQHLFTHQNDQRFECHICERTFTVKKTLDQHLKLHGIYRGKRFSCEHCDKKFFSDMACQVHAKSDHSYSKIPTQMESFKCGRCEKEFKHSESLSKHLNYAHVLEENIDCQVCGKACLTTDGLNRHMKSHDFDKPA